MRHAFLIPLVFLALVGQPALPAFACPPCPGVQSSESSKRAAIEANERVLRETREYLARRDRAPSRALAAQMNIVILELRIETLKNELELLSLRSQQGCAPCGS